jgi:hypothetical protein
MDTTLLIYTFFVAACLARRWLVALSDRLSLRPAWQLLVFFLLSGTLTEALAWGSNYAEAAEHPALLHPQLIPDIILGFGFYGGWVAAWLIAFRWFRFTLAETFLITGFQGVFFEQLGAVAVKMWQVLPTNPLLSVDARPVCHDRSWLGCRPGDGPGHPPIRQAGPVQTLASFADRHGLDGRTGGSGNLPGSAAQLALWRVATEAVHC